MVKNKIKNKIEVGFYSCTIFVELQKIFDTVDHNIPLKKLDHYNISSNWFSSCLTDRRQYVPINGFRF